jgi:hypothetical protein
VSTAYFSVADFFSAFFWEVSFVVAYALALDFFSSTIFLFFSATSLFFL